MCKHGNLKQVETSRGDVSVDSCIAPLVDLLNKNGFETIASCCGHENRPANIALRDGRELIIARNFEEAREIGKQFPDIWGNELPSQ